VERQAAAQRLPSCTDHFRPLFDLFLTGLATRGAPDSIAAMQSSIALSEDIAAFIQSGISMTLASRDDRFVPSIAKGVGCRVSSGRDAVTVLVFANTAEALLRDVAHCKQLAAVFSQPSTNRTLQIKGRDVTTAPAGPADVALTRRFIALFADELRPLGWSADYVHHVFWHDPVQLVALHFTPEGAFQQTPGPGAGAVLCLETGAAR
jgi:hypothetical protein